MDGDSLTSISDVLPTGSLKSVAWRVAIPCSFCMVDCVLDTEEEVRIQSVDQISLERGSGLCDYDCDLN